jgi:hypothetical protein
MSFSATSSDVKRVTDFENGSTFAFFRSKYKSVFSSFCFDDFEVEIQIELLSNFTLPNFRRNEKDRPRLLNKTRLSLNPQL